MFTSYGATSPFSLPPRCCSRQRGRGWVAVPVTSEAVHPRRKGTGVLTPKPFLDTLTLELPEHSPVARPWSKRSWGHARSYFGIDVAAFRARSMPRAIGCARKTPQNAERASRPAGRWRMAVAPRAEPQPTDAEGYAGCGSAHGSTAMRHRRGPNTFLTRV